MVPQFRLSSVHFLTWVGIVAVSAVILATPFSTLAQTTAPNQMDPGPGNVCQTGYSLQVVDATPGVPTVYTCTSDAAVQKAKDDPTICSVWNWSFNTCIAIPVMSTIGSVFLTIGATALIITGQIFDILVQRVIIDFKGTLGTLDILGAIDIGWSIFRDITNLFIIGLFVFIAINIILGVERFGQKKMIANVLIIAILLNFSLLFTKIIIDGSNFTAYQIYKQMGTPDGQTAQTPNIAAGFLKPMGITATFNTYSLVESFGRNTNNALSALMFGIVGGILLLTVAFVLGYGCYLIAARGLMLILLMLTASLAFLTFLIPSLQNSEYGWNAWWKALINTAIFAPILMVFLFISLLIMNQAGNVTKGSVSNLGAVIADPTLQATQGGWQIIFVYLIGIGLLFASLKISSKLAGSAGSMGSVSGGLMKALGKWPAAATLMGVSAMGSKFATNRFGGAAARKSQEHSVEIDRLSTKAALHDVGTLAHTQLTKQITDLKNQKAELDKTASRDFNLLNTKLGGRLGKVVGVGAGEAKGGYAGPRKAAAEEAAKGSADLIKSSGDAQKMATEAVKAAQEEERKSLNLVKQTNEEILKAASARADTEKEGHRTEIERNTKEAAESAQKKLTIEENYRSGSITSEQRTEQLRAEDNKIKEANNMIRSSRQAMKLIDDSHLETRDAQKARKAISDAHEALRALDIKAKQEVARTADQIVSNSLATATEVASSLVEADGYTKAEIAKKLRSKQSAKRVIDRIKAEKEIAKDAGEESGGVTT